MKPHPLSPLITSDSRLAFGRWCIDGTAIDVDAVTSRFLAGDRVAVLAADYEVTTEKIWAAIEVGMAERKTEMEGVWMG